jgi:insertion element IS1 protein InsB
MQKNGVQKFHCARSRKYQQKVYAYRACKAETGKLIRLLVRESVGIRGISRVPGIAGNTVMPRIRSAAATLEPPQIEKDQPCCEVNELWTYVGRKKNEPWVAYALDKETRVVDFVVGRRSVSTLRQLTDRQLASRVKKIRTDRLTHYLELIPKDKHQRSIYGINHIERKN